MREKLKDRYVILALVFTLFTGMIILRLFELQVVKGEDFDQQSQRRLLRETSIPAARGKIVDRYGIPLAVNRSGYTVKIYKSDMKREERHEMLLQLAMVFDRNNESYGKKLAEYLTFNPIGYGTKIDEADETKARNKWIKDTVVLKEAHIAELTSPQKIFEYFRTTKFKIDQKYTDEQAYKIMSIEYDLQIYRYTRTSAYTLAQDVSESTMAEIEARHQLFKGVVTEIEPGRKYINGSLVAHLLGYVRTISSDEYKELKDQGYKINDLIGKEGIEKSAESYLRGKEGTRKVEVDTNGRQTFEIASIPPEPGHDVVLTIDTHLQKVALQSLEKNIMEIRARKDNKKYWGDANAGSVVAMDVKTGEILVMANYPYYDPAIYLPGAGKEAQQQIASLNKDPNRALYNRAIKGAYAPGSTFKPLTGIAVLEEGVIKPSDTVYDAGRVTLGGHEFWCLEYKNKQGAHGNIDLREALATSCNIFFHIVGVDLTIARMDKWAKAFGLGEKTGIDIPGELQGYRNSPEALAQLQKIGYYTDKTHRWTIADTAQAAIGQNINMFTPIQLVRYTSAIANGGKLLQPHLIKTVLKYDGTVIKEAKPEFSQIVMSDATIKAVQNGMIAVANANDGTAVDAFKELKEKGYEVAGKTGTPETGREKLGESSNGLFICYAPADDPQIAIAVVIEHGAWGSNAAPVANEILKEYFNLNNKKVVDDNIQTDSVVFTN